MCKVSLLDCLFLQEKNHTSASFSSHVNFDISFFIRNISCLYLHIKSEMLLLAFKAQMHRNCISNFLTTRVKCVALFNNSHHSAHSFINFSGEVLLICE